MMHRPLDQVRRPFLKPGRRRAPSATLTAVLLAQPFVLVLLASTALVVLAGLLMIADPTVFGMSGAPSVTPSPMPAPGPHWVMP